MPRRLTAALLGVASLVLLAAPALAADSVMSGKEPFELTAEVIEFQSRRDLYIAEGDVRIIHERRRIRADWVAFNSQTRVGVAAGNVRVSDGKDLIVAELVEFDIDTLEGLIFAGQYDSGPRGFKVRALVMERIASSRYAIEDAELTTCRCPDDERQPWKVKTHAGKVNVGGYGWAKNTTFEVLGVPVLWFPWLFFPVKDQRESGLLFPLFGFSGRHGFGFGIPIFWAARENINVIATPVYLTKRGFKPRLKVEAVWGERSFARAYGTTLDDKKIDDPDSAGTPYSSRRWLAELDMDQELPADWTFRADVRLMSDNEYVTDFDELRGRRKYRYLESTGFAFGDFLPDGGLGAVGSVVVADDLMNPDDRDRDRFLLQRAPHLQLDLLSAPVPRVGPLVASVDTDYIFFTAVDDVKDELPPGSLGSDPNFADVGIEALPDSIETFFPQAPGAALDLNCDNFIRDPLDIPRCGAEGGGPEGDGRFQEGEPLRDRGHRLDLRPRIGLPFQIADTLSVYPEVAYAETMYFTRNQSFAERGLFTAQVDLRSRFRGRFDWLGLPPTTHILEPRLSWAYLRTRNQDGNPVFVPKTALPERMIRQLTLENVLRDSADRIDDANLVRFGLSNRFFVGSRLGPVARSEVELSLAYDFERDALDLLVVDGASFPQRGPNTRFHLAFDPNSKTVAQGLFELAFNTSQRRWLWANVGGSYRYRRKVPRIFEDFQPFEASGGDFDSNSRFSFYEPIDRISEFRSWIRLHIGTRWAVGYRAGYSFDQDLWLTNSGSVDYVSKCRCWTLGLELSESRTRGLRFYFRFNLLGLGDSVDAPIASGPGLGSDDL